MKPLKLIMSLVFVFCIFCEKAEAAKSAIKGDPEVLWLSPLGKENIENTPYNRCLLIKKMKPDGSAEQINQNNYEILAEYTANLYAQSVKIAAYLEEETKKEKEVNYGKLNDEVSIIKKLILRRLADISRRVNIINSFEAGTSMLESLMAISAMSVDVYADIIDCCSFLTASECKKEKACEGLCDGAIGTNKDATQTRKAMDEQMKNYTTKMLEQAN